MGSGNDEQPPRDANWNVKRQMGQNRSLPHEVEASATESVEQYTRLHEHIERLRNDRRPVPPGALAPEEVRIYQLAALLHGAAWGAAIPDPIFVASLCTHLREELATGAEPLGARPSAVDAHSPMPAIGPRGAVSRRALIGAGLGAAAAGLTVGAVLTRAGGSAPNTQPSVALVPGGSGMWVRVASVQDIPLGGVKRFNTDAIVGYVRHTPSGFSALSGVCSHMGCLLKWNGTARTYDCPCHGARFSEDGRPAAMSPASYRPLAQIATRMRGDNVEVYVPPTSGPIGQRFSGNRFVWATATDYQVGK